MNNKTTVVLTGLWVTAMVAGLLAFSYLSPIDKSIDEPIPRDWTAKVVPGEKSPYTRNIVEN